jgi:hypothetical protein
MRDIKKLANGDYIRCRTQEQWDYISKLIDKEWGNARWTEYKDQSVIYANTKTYGSYFYAKDRNQLGYEAAEFMPVKEKTDAEPSDFEVGKFARCSRLASGGGVTVDRMYKILDQGSSCIKISSDNGIGWYNKMFFTPTDTVEVALPAPRKTHKFKAGDYVITKSYLCEGKVYQINFCAGFGTYFTACGYCFSDSDLIQVPPPPALPDGYKWPNGYPAFVFPKLGDALGVCVLGRSLAYKVDESFLGCRCYKIEKIENPVLTSDISQVKSSIEQAVEAAKMTPIHEPSSSFHVETSEIKEPFQSLLPVQTDNWNVLSDEDYALMKPCRTSRTGKTPIQEKKMLKNFIMSSLNWGLFQPLKKTMGVAAMPLPYLVCYSLVAVSILGVMYPKQVTQTVSQYMPRLTWEQSVETAAPQAAPQESGEVSE